MRSSRRSRSVGGDRSGTLVVVLVCVLAVTAAGVFGQSTDAFTSGTVSRGSTADVAGDSSGLIGLDVASSVTAGSESRLVTVTNRLDRTTAVTVSLDGSTGTLTNGQATLAPGGTLTTAVTVSCESSATSVSFTVRSNAGTNFTGVATRTTSVDDSDCGTDSQPLEFVSGSATTGSFSGPSGSNTGSLGFSIQNTESTTRTVTAFELLTVGDATALSYDGPPPVNAEAGKDELYVDATGGPTDSVGAAEASRGDPPYAVGTGTAYSLDQSVTVDPGETADVSLYRFVDGATPYAFSPDDPVDIRLTFADGSTTTVSFRT